MRSCLHPGLLLPALMAALLQAQTTTGAPVAVPVFYPNPNIPVITSAKTTTAAPTTIPAFHPNPNAPVITSTKTTTTAPTTIPVFHPNPNVPVITSAKTTPNFPAMTSAKTTRNVPVITSTKTTTAAPTTIPVFHPNPNVPVITSAKTTPNFPAMTSAKTTRNVPVITSTKTTTAAPTTVPVFHPNPKVPVITSAKTTPKVPVITSAKTTPNVPVITSTKTTTAAPTTVPVFHPNPNVPVMTSAKTTPNVPVMTSAKTMPNVQVITSTKTTTAAPTTVPVFHPNPKVPETTFLTAPATPPWEPPVLISRVDGVDIQSENGVLDIPQGAMLELRCSVDEGSPPVSEIVITLGEKKMSFAGTEGRLEERIGSSHDGQEIQCSAKHESGAYDKKTIVMINVTHPFVEAPILKVFVNGHMTQATNGGDLPVKPKDTLLVACSVPRGDPLVSNTTIEFGNERKTVRGSVVMLSEKVVGAHFHQYVVKCTAELESGNYDKWTSFIIHVEDTEPTNELPTAIVVLLQWGPIIGLVLVGVIVVALILVCCLRCHKMT